MTELERIKEAAIAMFSGRFGYAVQIASGNTKDNGEKSPALTVMHKIAGNLARASDNARAKRVAKNGITLG